MTGNAEALFGRPLLFQRNLVRYVVPGGDLLGRFLGEPGEEMNPPSQLWPASTVPSALGDGTEGLSRLRPEYGGFFFRDLLAGAPEAFLGPDHVRSWGADPGILIKLLNSRDRLLVQVHPDRERASRYFGSPFGKTEAWHVVAAKPGAVVYAGFRPGIGKEALRAAIEGQDSARILSLLHEFPVKAGDTLFIPAGLPHALGKDSLVLEIQEPTDITLRAERRRPSGELLPESMLHGGAGMEALLDCFNYDAREAEEAGRGIFVEPVKIDAGGGVVLEDLVSYRTTPYFSMRSVELAPGARYAGELGAFAVCIVLSGEGIIEQNGRTLPLRRGTDFFIPHGMGRYEYRSAGGLRIVECYPPVPKNQ